MGLTYEQQELVIANTGLVWQQAFRFGWRLARQHGHRQAFRLAEQYSQELAAAGMVALCQAAAGFDATLGYQFSTYAFPCIRHAMHRFIKESLFWGREANCPILLFSERAREGHGLQVVAEPKEDPDDLASDEELRALLFLALDPRRAQAVYDRVVVGQGLSEMAKNLGISKERARQLVLTGCRQLRDNQTVRRVLDQRKKRVLSRHDFDSRVAFRIA